jgi:NAD(P) transhydrogenase subunit alpha
MADIFFMTAVFGLSFGMGYLLIAKIPPRLHTPLMSMTNAISAVVILGTLVLLSVPRIDNELILVALAIVAASFNIAGGIFITDRMLKMFKTKPLSTFADGQYPKATKR